MEIGCGKRTGKRKLVFLVALEDLPAGTEVNIDYGDDNCDVKVRPSTVRPIIICDCDSEVCCGEVWRKRGI